MNEGDENKGQMIAEEDGTGRRHNTRRNKKDMKGISIYHPSLDDRVREGGREKKEKKDRKKKRPRREIVQTLPDVTPNGVGRMRILFGFIWIWRHVRRARVGIRMKEVEAT